MINQIEIIKQNIFEELVGNIRKMIKDELEKFKNSFVQQKDDEIFYNIEQVAAMLGIQKKTMYSLNNRKEIAFSKFAGQCFYSKKDITEAINRGRIKPKYEIEQDAQKSILNLKNK